MAVQHRTTLEASHRLRRPNNEFFLRSPQEAGAVFAAYPEAIANTTLISERCKAFNLADRDAIGYSFPDFTRKSNEQHASADTVLARYCWARFHERYPSDQTPLEFYERARKQLQEELLLVAKHNLSGFFLIYRDIQELATRGGPRGSWRRHGSRWIGPAARPWTRLIGQLDHLLSDRPLTR